MTHVSTSLSRLGLLGLLLASPAVFAQNVYNAGSTIALTGGAVLYVPGNVTNTSGTVGGTTTNGTLDLTNGTLQVGGNLTNTTGSSITPGAGKVLLNGAAQQAVDLAGATLYDVEVNNTATGTNAGVDVNSDFTVSHNLLFTSGKLYTGSSRKIMVPNGGTVSGETGTKYVVGNLEVSRTGVSGSSVDFQNGVTIAPASNLGNVTVTRTAGLKTTDSYGVNPNDASKKGIDQIWRIVAANQPTVGNPAQTTFRWLAENDNGLTFNSGNAQVWKKAETTGAPWLPVGPLQSGTGRAVTVAAESFSFWTVSTTDAPLPVELLAFTAVREGDAARLNWRTATERNSAYFGVEVSTDGRSFRQLAQVPAQGTKASATAYVTTDPALLRYAASPVYYRLRMVDADGKEGFSPVRPVLVGGTAFTALLFPNPAGAEGTQLQVRTATAGPADVVVYDALGRQLLRQRADLTTGPNTLDLSATGRLASGAYFVKIQQNKQQAVLKFTRE